MAMIRAKLIPPNVLNVSKSQFGCNMFHVEQVLGAEFLLISQLFHVERFTHELCVLDVNTTADAGVSGAGLWDRRPSVPRGTHHPQTGAQATARPAR
jgi:hypothetical protein